MAEDMTELEIWKDIEGYEGYYQVSNLGNVRSIDRIGIVWSTRYNHYIERKIKGRIMAQQDDRTGYHVIYFTKNGNHKRLYVHRLVARAFIPNPDNKPEVNHIDFNRHNNNINNLEWVTRHENMRHTAFKLRRPRKSKPTKTGEKYITIKNGKYRFCIWHKYDKSFATLEEAIAAREVYFSA